MKVIAIYAISENGIIGNGNELPWKLSADLQYFKQLTLRKSIIMGRKTWDCLGKPLPKRRSIVVTRNPDFHLSNAEVVPSLEKAIEICKNEEEVFIIGGAQILKDAFEKGLVTEIRQTLVHADVEGDVQMPFPNEEEWKIVSVDAQQADDKNEYAYTFLVFQKR
jgi:dihydrofolate reductase